MIGLTVSVPYLTFNALVLRKINNKLRVELFEERKQHRREQESHQDTNDMLDIFIGEDIKRNSK